MKQQLIFLVCILLSITCMAQPWKTDNSSADNKNWNNYSTTYIGDVDPAKEPFIVSAVPENGVYHIANAPLEMSHSGSGYKYQSNLDQHGYSLATYDSSNVYFLVPGIYRNNAFKFQYRILLNGKTVIKNWSDINTFSDFQLNTFKKGFAYLGGYSTTWGNFIKAEVKEKSSNKVIASSVIYWKETKPQVVAIYISENLNDFFNSLQRSWNRPVKSPGLPSKPEFSSSEKNIIFCINANIVKKEALEFQLIKDGDVYTDWRPNEYDNDFIWLKDLPPGKYKLNLRFRAQRQNITGYDFEIAPQWQQTTTFKIIGGSLIAASVGFILLLDITAQQKRKLKEEQLHREKTEMHLQSLRSQLNPHFVFNALSSIQGLINNNKTDSANEYLSAFSSLLRQSLQYNNQKTIPLAVEMQMLVTYIKLEQLRFPFKYNIYIDENINRDAVEIPSMLLQPLVENAVKHGLSSLQTKGELNISVNQKRTDMIITIKDNSKGFDTNITAKGYGLQLTRDRISMFNQTEKGEQIEFMIQSGSEGTTATLVFKNRF